RPSIDRCEIQTTDPRIVPTVDRRIGTVALRVVLREALLEMELGGLKVAAAVQGRPQRVMGLEKKAGISELPGQAEKFLPEFSRFTVEPAVKTHMPQAPEGWEEPKPVIEPETQLSGGNVGGFVLTRAVPVYGAEAGTESDADVEGLAERFLAFGQLLKHVQGLFEERDRLSVGGAHHCFFRRQAQVPHRALPHPSAHRMLRQPLH